MKMPTKHTNTKRNFLAIGGIAAVVGVTPVATTFAHGGLASSHDTRTHSAVHQSGDFWRGPGHFVGHGQDWWHIPSLESFKKRSNAKLALIDKVIDKYDLTVENNATLRANVETDAATVEAALTTYQQLRAELDNSDSTPTDEQKTALKQATLAALGALYDYRESMHDYVSAVINAFKAKWNDESKLKQFKQEL